MRLTPKQKEALHEALVESIRELLDEHVVALVNDAQWKTNEDRGPSAYWTPEVEQYLESKIAKVHISLPRILGKKKRRS